MDFVQFPNVDSMFLSSLAKAGGFSLSCMIINSINVFLGVLYYRLHHILEGHINCIICVKQNREKN